MGTYTIDCAAVTDEDGFWLAYLSATNPEGAGYFGRNLDAFWDALHGGPGWPGECNLCFINISSISHFREGQFYSALQQIATDSKHVRIRLE